METRSTCPYCGVGCGVVIEHDGRQITGVRGDPEHPANFGRLCTKGSTLHLTATPIVMQTRRLLHPMANGQPLSWDEANTQIAEKLLAIRQQHGPDAIGFYISGQLLTEDYHAFNKLARAVIGTNNIDSNSRLCMSSAVVGYKQSLGADAPPCSYEDLDHADCVFITGANPAWAHPILFRRLEDAKAKRPQMKIIVADPRRTESAEFADLHLQILPGTDVALCHGLLHAMIWEGWVDAAFIAQHTSGFDELKALVRDMPPREAARICGITEQQLLQAAEWFATSPATLSLYCQGLNQSSSGTAKNTALINLHLAAAQIGRPGAGPFSLTGQPNAMGGRESGGMASLLPGHRDPNKAEDRAEIARLWGVDALPANPGKTAVELFQAAERGEIKALWIVCTNPAQSLPEQALVRRALERCELVIVQEAFADTATCAFADYLLPAATWGEKEGTVTNSERRISRVRAAVLPPGEARADWRIARDVAHAMGAAFSGSTPEQLWLEHREATRGRDLDITGLSYALLDQQGPQQWPFPEHASTGAARLYEDRRFATPDGLARFIAKPYAAPLSRPDARRPWSLTTGRLRDQWHGMSRSGVVPRLFGHEGTPALALNPQDMSRRGLAEGDYARVSSVHGAVVLQLRGDDAVAPMQASLPMHWGAEFLGIGVNEVTQPGFCPDSKQPELKFSAVAIEKLALPWRISGAAWSEPGRRGRLRALLSAFDYAHCVPVAGPEGREGWSFEAASSQPPSAELVKQLAAALGLDGTVGLLRYADAGRGRSRLLRLSADGKAVDSLLLVGEAGVAAWLLPLWREGQPVAPFGRQLLAPHPQGPANATPRSPQVCNCLDVSEARIREHLVGCAGSESERLASLQGALRCGTQCGSCLPTLRRLVTQIKPEELVT
ncbi:nitrate reductase [Pelomonas sp. KK5]|uniref:nitrate reductase n=1 Tax=Pelomonas sp. KK5 TaxID=1855730 RepID=UPI00097C7C03|nr:nitrate reductase [Pelomonas sp. KK5]